MFGMWLYSTNGGFISFWWLKVRDVLWFIVILPWTVYGRTPLELFFFIKKLFNTSLSCAYRVMLKCKIIILMQGLFLVTNSIGIVIKSCHPFHISSNDSFPIRALGLLFPNIPNTYIMEVFPSATRNKYIVLYTCYIARSKLFYIDVSMNGCNDVLG